MGRKVSEKEEAEAEEEEVDELEKKKRTKPESAPSGSSSVRQRPRRQKAKAVIRDRSELEEKAAKLKAWLMEFAPTREGKTANEYLLHGFALADDQQDFRDFVASEILGNRPIYPVVSLTSKPQDVLTSLKHLLQTKSQTCREKTSDYRGFEPFIVDLSEYLDVEKYAKTFRPDKLDTLKEEDDTQRIRSKWARKIADDMFEKFRRDLGPTDYYLEFHVPVVRLSIPNRTTRVHSAHIDFTEKASIGRLTKVGGPEAKFQRKCAGDDMDRIHFNLWFPLENVVIDELLISKPCGPFSDYEVAKKYKPVTSNAYFMPERCLPMSFRPNMKVGEAIVFDSFNSIHGAGAGIDIPKRALFHEIGDYPYLTADFRATFCVPKVRNTCFLSLRQLGK